MKIHEYQAIELFQKSGIPVAQGRVAGDLAEAQAIAAQIGFPVVLKAQVLTGGRGKSGGVAIVANSKELKEKFLKIKDLVIQGYPVDRVLVVQALSIQREFYLAVTVDALKNDVVLIASLQGGVDIEETAKKSPEKIQKYYFNGRRGVDPESWRPFIQSVFPEPLWQEAVSKISVSLVELFYRQDCSLAEINPLVIDQKGQFYAADAKITFDDNALFRHPELLDLRDLKYEDPDELEARQNDLSFIKMEGNVGCIVNGAGLAMATLDCIGLLGGRPANFLDVGGSSSPQKVLNALWIILKNTSVKSILINIFGGITRCDDIAQGILKAKKELNIQPPLVVRLTGTNEQQAKDLLAGRGINTFSSMREAVERAVALART